MTTSESIINKKMVVKTLLLLNVSLHLNLKFKLRFFDYSTYYFSIKYYPKSFFTGNIPQKCISTQ